VAAICAAGVARRVGLLRGRGAAIDSLAVLPFGNDRVNATNDYLSAGMTESLINNLAQVPNLKVIFSLSSFSFKRKPTDPKAAGQALGVRGGLLGAPSGEWRRVSGTRSHHQPHRHRDTRVRRYDA
jgi:TolB-like protein